MSGPRSLHVISSLRLRAGGPTQSVTRLCEALNRLGAAAEIATVADPDGDSGPTLEFPVHAFPRKAPGRLWRSPDLATFLQQEAHRFDVIHMHGLWEWPGRYARKTALGAGRPLVISPRGMLEAWSLRQRSPLKRIALACWEGRNLRAASLLHATSQAEADQFRTLGLTQAIAVVPNGLCFPEPPPAREPGPPTALLLSRFHPKKGADLLLRAWANLGLTSWRLILAGPDPDGYRARLEALARDLGLGPSVAFLDPLYDEAKWRLLQQVHLFILPSHSENFGNVVVEALSQGVPVIATEGTPWQELLARECGWWVPATPEGLSAGLRDALGRDPAELAEMGRRGQAWAKAAFSAEATARSMLRHYAQLQSGEGPLP